MNESKNQTSIEINQVLNQPYKYGFETKVETERFPAGITLEILKAISEEKQEPLFISEFRQNAFEKWQKMKLPDWANLSIQPIDFTKITYFSRPKKRNN